MYYPLHCQLSPTTLIRHYHPPGLALYGHPLGPLMAFWTCLSFPLLLALDPRHIPRSLLPLLVGPRTHHLLPALLNFWDQAELAVFVQLGGLFG